MTVVSIFQGRADRLAAAYWAEFIRELGLMDSAELRQAAARYVSAYADPRFAEIAREMADGSKGGGVRSLHQAHTQTLHHLLGMNRDIDSVPASFPNPWEFEPRGTWVWVENELTEGEQPIAALRAKEVMKFGGAVAQVHLTSQRILGSLIAPGPKWPTHLRPLWTIHRPRLRMTVALDTVAEVSIVAAAPVSALRILFGTDTLPSGGPYWALQFQFPRTEGWGFVEALTSHLEQAHETIPIVYQNE